MKYFNLRSLFLLNGLLESLAGVFLLMYPQYILLGAQLDTNSVAITKMYGLAALCLGIISYLCFRSYQVSDFFRKTFLVFAAFHILIAFQFYGYMTIGIVTHSGPFLLHLCLGLVFCLAIVTSPKPTNSEEA